VSASGFVTEPEGIGLLTVLFMILSISASYHILSTPEAPAPIAIQVIEIIAKKGCIDTGERIRPTRLVNITRDITLGFMSV
tara:strand:- start:13457 stop:13699 length:243 start_codon:yes stop_codon:yes gene_type:complete